MYAVQADAALSAEQTDSLRWLLGGADLLAQQTLDGVFVGPRREMITPWSTNAVEITQNMGLPGIRRIEQRTVFVLQCGDRLAVCKRPARGLLAGLWQLPDVPGKLETAEALRQAEQWGVHPTGILKTAERTHIFTHVQWDLRGVWLTCAAEAPQFTWADEDALRHEIGLPTAYRQFLDLHAE